VAEVLRKVLPPGSEKRVFSLEFVRLRWPFLVGRELALRSEPASLQDAVLTVRVSDAAWGRMILKLQGRILPRLREILGPKSVGRIRFVKDGEVLWKSGLPPVTSEVSEDKEHPGEVSALIAEAARDIEDAELRSLLIQTASRYLRAQANRRR
jgi:hypothetical protein